MADENKTMILKLDIDVSGLKKNGKVAEEQLEKLKIQQSLMRGQNQQGSLEYAKIGEQIRQYTKQLKDSAAAIVINESLTGKTNLTNIELALSQKALAVAYNNLTEEQKENTIEGQRITAQYKAVNDALIKNGKNVSDGRRSVGLYKEAIIDAYKELGTLKKESNQVGYAIGQTKKDIDNVSKSLDDMRKSGSGEVEAMARLEGELTDLNDILSAQEGILADVNTEINNQSAALAETEKEARKIGFVYGEQTDTVQSLKDELKELQNVLAANADDKLSAQYQEAAVRAGEVRDQLNDIRQTTQDLAGGTSFEKFSSTLGSLGEDLGNLDFEGVAEKAKNLESIADGTTFKETIEGAKNMGKAFISLGKVILANPLFLLVAVIAGVVAAIMYFSEETETAEEANEKLNASLEKSNKLFELQSERAVRAANNRLKLMEVQGAAEEDLLDQRLRILSTEEDNRQKGIVKAMEGIRDRTKVLKQAYSEEDEELIEKIKGEIESEREKYATLKNQDGQYFKDKEILILQSNNAVEKQRQEDLKKQQEANKKAYDDYKQKRDAELKLAKDISLKIQEATFKGQELTAANQRAIIDGQADYLTKIANLTISDAVELNESLLQIEQDRYEDLRRIDEAEKQLAIDRVRTAQANEISELKGSAEKIAEQKKLIEANTAQEIDAINIDYSKLEQDRETALLSAQKDIAESKKEVFEKSLNDRIIDLEANLQVELNLGREGVAQEIAIAAEKNKQIQNNELASIAEKKKAQAEYEASVIAINKASTDKQIEQEKELADKRKELQKAVTDAAQQLVTDAFTIRSQEIEKELNSEIESNNKKQESLQQQLDLGFISQQDYDSKKKKLDEDFRKKESEIKKKQFETNKQAQIINATIATAVAVAENIANPILAILAAVLGATQVAIIASQPTPAFAVGGRVLKTISGKRIGSGDGIPVKRANGDNLLATVKTNEVILNEAHQAALGGPAVFRSIGVPGFASGGYTGNNISREVNRQVDVGNIVIQAIKSMPAPEVDVKDIIYQSNQYVSIVDSAKV